MALPPEERPATCWCTKKKFPAGLTSGASRSRCICQKCRDEYLAADPDREQLPRCARKEPDER